MDVQSAIPIRCSAYNESKTGPGHCGLVNKPKQPEISSSLKAGKNSGEICGRGQIFPPNSDPQNQPRNRRGRQRTPFEPEFPVMSVSSLFSHGPASLDR